MTGSLQTKGDIFYAVLNYTDRQGKRKQKWISLGLHTKGNKRKAEGLLRDLLLKYDGILDLDAMNALLSQHIYDWITFVSTRIAKTTKDQYYNMLRNHIAPYFDNLRMTLNKLTPGDLEVYYKHKIESGLSPNTVIKHHAIIRSSLQWAMKHRYIRENVADLADKPTKERYQGNAPYTMEEINLLLQATQNDPIAVPIFLASFYGLRRSEILGLRWSSIDFAQQILHICTTVVREQKDHSIHTVIRENTTKTDTSRRSLPLSPYTCDYLLRLRQGQQYNQLVLGADYCADFLDFVCVGETGMLLQPDHVTHRFQKILAFHNFRPIRFHDLRHSCATIMLYLGYSLKDIQTWLGHSNYGFTADTYVHSSPTMHQQMANTFASQVQLPSPKLIEPMTFNDSI